MTKLEKNRVHVLGYTLSYVDRGAGDPIVFLHGNPTSSFLWRNVIAPLSKMARCIAPDLIGMGDSDKLVPSGPDAYTFARHSAFVDAFMDALRLDERIVLVVHDWGSALGFDWARRHPRRVRAIVYMEAIVGPLTWEGWHPNARALFERFQSPEGERLILEENTFVERVLPGSILRELTDDEREEYRRPFREPGESRRPTLAFPRELPVEGSPPEMCAIAAQYAAFLATSPIPKLFVNAEPGRILVGPLREACRRWPNQREITVRGAHFLQEDSPLEIAEAIADLLETLPAATRSMP